MSAAPHPNELGVGFEPPPSDQVMDDQGRDDQGRDYQDDTISLMERIQQDLALLKLIRESANEIIRLEGERKAINESISAIREDIVAHGINRHAFKAAVARFKLTEADREERELSYHACCVALGIEHQMDLLEAVEQTAEQQRKGIPPAVN